MRIVKYRQGSGRPTEAARGNLNELVMLMEAAVALASVERWVQDSVSATARRKAGATLLTEAIRSAGKHDSYEVSVVDGFMRLGAVSFAAHGSEAVWERTFPTGKRGRPPSVDVCLFNVKRDEEARVEFGAYSQNKLRDDSKKLAVELPATKDHRVSNFVMLWRTRESGVVATSSKWRDTCVRDARAVSTAHYDVKMEVASEQDMFVAASAERRKVQVALFSVTNNAAVSGLDAPAAESVDLPL